MIAVATLLLEVPAMAESSEEQAHHDYAGLAEQGAFHSSDITYWLGGVFTPDKTFSETDEKLGEIMSSYLVNFVTTGDVNGETVCKKRRR